MYEELKKVIEESNHIVFLEAQVSVQKAIFLIFVHKVGFIVRKPILIVPKQ